MGALALFDGVFELSYRMQAIAVRVLQVVEAGVPWPLSGARTFPVWLAARAHLTRARAPRVTRLARALIDPEGAGERFLLEQETRRRLAIHRPPRHHPGPVDTHR